MTHAPSRTPADLSVRRLVLVRHGETVGQSSIRYYGSTDIGLSDTGVGQMQWVRERLAAERFDAVFTSAMQRTVQAAAIIAPHLPARPIADFNEICFGAWEGLTREEIEQRDPDRFAVWQANRFDFHYPGGDRVSSFRERVTGAFVGLLPSLPQHTLLIAHRGVVSTILGELLRLAPEERAELGIDLGSIHILRASAGIWHAELLNASAAGDASKSR